MRILLRDKQTLLFWAGGGNWTSIEEQAFDFHTTSNAFNFATHLRVEELEVVLASAAPALSDDMLAAE